MPIDRESYSHSIINGFDKSLIALMQEPQRLGLPSELPSS
jgi:hypothetical protein